uniref:HNH endonuclease n=1 Tax=Panagrolaimus superbus TaxID=310955 RepID=A0A914YBQ6_9BILA
MLEYFLTQNAHCVEDSLSVNCARNVILQLSYPMALISASVQEALAKNKEKQALIKKYENDEKELRKILIKRIPIKKWKLEYYDKKYCERCSAQALYYGNDRLHFVEADAYAMNEEHYSLTTPKNYLENWTDLCPTCEKNTRPVKGTRWLSWSLETREEEDVTEAARLKEKLGL